MHACIHSCMHAYTHMQVMAARYPQVHMYTCMHAFIHAYIHTSMYRDAEIYLPMHAHEDPDTRRGMASRDLSLLEAALTGLARRMVIHTCIHIYMHAYVNAFTHAHMHARMQLGCCTVLCCGSLSMECSHVCVYEWMWA